MGNETRTVAPLVLRPLAEPLRDIRFQDAPGGTLQDVLALLRRRWRVIATTTAVVVAATAVYCLLVPRWYQARATVMIEGRSPELLNGRGVGQGEDAFTSAKYDYYQTQFELLQSPALAQRVILALGLADDPRFNGGDAAAGPVELVSRYRNVLTIQPVRGTRLVEVQFLSTDPALAAEVANTHARLFVRVGLDRLYGAMEQVRSFLETKLGALQKRLQEGETDVLRYQAEHRLLPVDVNKDVGSERLMELSRRLTAAEADRIGLEAQYRLVEGGDLDGIPAVLASPLIQRLREEYDRLEVEHALVAQRFTQEYPGRRELGGQLAHARAQLKAETKKVAQGVKANYLAAERTVERLQAELDEQRRTLIDRKDEEGELLTKMREVETTRALHDNLLTRVKDLDVMAGADASNVTVVEPAIAPRWPASPNVRLALLLSLAVGLLFGTGVAFVRDAADSTLRDAADVRRTMGIGTLAVIPDLEGPPPGPMLERLRWQGTHAWHMTLQGFRNLASRPQHDGKAPARRTPLFSLTNAHGAALAEAYRNLRASLLLAGSGDPPRIILITSAAGGAGKTSTAVNAAAALAACGSRVLLIDADLRLPSCHRALGCSLAPGLSDFLADPVSAEPFQETEIDNLSLLAAGRSVVNPAELLTSPSMQCLLAEARARFDFVVVDSPPLLAVSDALLLARLVDGAILVTEHGRTSRDQATHALERLRGSGVALIGAVVNRGPIEQEYYRYSRSYEDVAAAG
jgi:polysaccharide biosynthesis transport protein